MDTAKVFSFDNRLDHTNWSIKRVSRFLCIGIDRHIIPPVLENQVEFVSSLEEVGELHLQQYSFFILDFESFSGEDCQFLKKEGARLIFIGQASDREDFIKHQRSEHGADAYFVTPLDMNFIEYLREDEGQNLSAESSEALPPQIPEVPVTSSDAEDLSLAGEEAPVISSEYSAGEDEELETEPITQVVSQEEIKALFGNALEDSDQEVGTNSLIFEDLDITGLEFTTTGDQKSAETSQEEEEATSGEITQDLAAQSPLETPEEEDSSAVLESEEELLTALENKETALASSKREDVVPGEEERKNNLYQYTSEDLQEYSHTIKNVGDAHQHLCRKIEEMEGQRNKLEHDFVQIQAQYEELKVQYVLLEKKSGQMQERFDKRAEVFKDKILHQEEQLQSKTQVIEEMQKEHFVKIEAIKKNERELAQKITLLEKDARAQIEEREKELIKMRRRVDSLEFDLTYMEERQTDHMEKKQHVENGLQKVMDQLQSTLLEIESDLYISQQGKFLSLNKKKKTG